MISDMLDDLTVKRAGDKEAKALVKQQHYAKGTHNAPTSYGLYYKDRLVGVCMFSTPGAEDVRSWVFGKGNEHEMTELHRLVMLSEIDWPERPANILSWFVTKVFFELRREKPQIWAVLTFSDTTEGHSGAIYKALNALYYGLTRERRLFWMDKDGRLRHPRQNGKNIKKADAIAMGWTQVRREKKHKFLFLLGTSRQKKANYKRLIHKPLNAVELGFEKVNGGVDAN